MPELAISKSILMNHGLGVGAFVPGFELAEKDRNDIESDPVQAFKTLMTTSPVSDGEQD